MIFVYSSRSEVSRWARLNFFFFCPSVCLCVSLITFISSTPYFHWHWTQNYFCCFLSRSRVLFPLPCLQQGLQVRQKSQRDTIISLLSLYRSDFLCLIIFFCFSLLWEFCCTQIIQTTEKQVPSAPCIKNTTPTMKIIWMDVHLLFLLCSLVNLLISYPSVSVSVFLSFSLLPNLYFFLFCLLTALFIAAPSLHKVIIFPSKSAFAKILFSLLFSSFPLTARSPGEQEWREKT